MGTAKQTIELTLSDVGQRFAGVATIRQAIFDIIDGGMNGDATEPWEFHLDLLASDQDLIRSSFVDAVIKRIAELQTAPHDGIRIENLCDKHKREVLPVPTKSTCGMCQSERGK